MFTTMILLTISIPLGCVLMVSNYYPFLPLNFVTAVFVVYNLYHIARRISQNESMFVNVLKFVGKSSILVLCVHIIELDYDPIPDLFFKINISKYIIYTMIILYRVLATIIVTYILYQFIIIRRLYQLK